jgi:hypothetical protein
LERMTDSRLRDQGPPRSTCYWAHVGSDIRSRAFHFPDKQHTCRWTCLGPVGTLSEALEAFRIVSGSGPVRAEFTRQRVELTAKSRGSAFPAPDIECVKTSAKRTRTVQPPVGKTWQAQKASDSRHRLTEAALERPAEIRYSGTSIGRDVSDRARSSVAALYLQCTRAVEEYELSWRFQFPNRPARCHDSPRPRRRCNAGDR